MTANREAARPTLRERRRAELQHVIGVRAAELFQRQGLQATTVEEIAEAAGISLRTFYRHCAVKDDALTPLLAQGVHDMVALLAARPVGEPLAVSARAALVESIAPTGEGSRNIARVMLGEPSLKARWLAAGRQAQDLLAPVLRDRLGPGTGELRAAVTAGFLINVATTALEHWALHDDAGPLEAVVEEAFDGIADRTGL
ncbi:TetR family transcriptional regulator [Actinocorallia herbida]|uniref:TetR family transcriptional regulator n=1 Tax=Actinocorallia herbida TaxID=58109 RepID=A0A3N1CVY1_9ACTN|nr:TetR family transcriptional regulator [Actinocorallia herbida]ROO85440.1 TetR family transcriptional regulator [Actinocorallia herbida]